MCGQDPKAGDSTVTSSTLSTEGMKGGSIREELTFWGGCSRPQVAPAGKRSSDG